MVNFMKSIRIKSYGKINLSLDVIGKLDNGYHEVEMVMHQIELCDEVLIRWYPNKDIEGIEISLKTNKYYLPTDDRNLAKKAGKLMHQFAPHMSGNIRIDIMKRIPVAAGLAGGSGNAAAVIHGLNKLWRLEKSLEELCNIGATLGADVPFMIMGQARGNKNLDKKITKDPKASSCAIASGTGTTLIPIASLDKRILLSKPKISVSTKEVYEGVDLLNILDRPDNKELIQGLEKKDCDKIKNNIVNVLEAYTIKKYDTVAETKRIMKEVCPKSKVAMSGSGPTIFGIIDSEEELEKGYEALRNINKETYKTRTTI